MNRLEFSELTKKLLILDGATGSNLMLAGMPRGTRPEQWLQEHPEALITLQRAYVEAGSQMVYAPTFTASRAYHKSNIRDYNEKMVMLSREAVPTAYVAGDLTTVGTRDFDIGDMYPVYREQLSAVIDAGVDALAIETMMGLDETVAAVDTARQLCDLPILVSFSVMSDGALYFGGNIFDAVETLEALGIDALGVNCSSGPEGLVSIIHHLHDLTALPLVAKPNAGMPEIDLQGHAVYSMGPEAFAAAMLPLINAGASVVGGCCGTTPAHIQALCRAARR